MGLRTSLSHFRAARRGTPHLAAPIQLASAAWRHKVKNTNQQTRSVRGQPAEAPHLATASAAATVSNTVRSAIESDKPTAPPAPPPAATIRKEERLKSEAGTLIAEISM